MYAAFYIVAGEYPLRPVIYGGVQKIELVTVVVYGERLAACAGVLLLLLITIIF